MTERPADDPYWIDDLTSIYEGKPTFAIRGPGVSWHYTFETDKKHEAEKVLGMLKAAFRAGRARQAEVIREVIGAKP